MNVSLFFLEHYMAFCDSWICDERSKCRSQCYFYILVQLWTEVSFECCLIVNEINNYYFRGAVGALVLANAFQPIIPIAYIKLRKLHTKTWGGVVDRQYSHFYIP